MAQPSVVSLDNASYGSKSTTVASLDDIDFQSLESPQSMNGDEKEAQRRHHGNLSSTSTLDALHNADSTNTDLHKAEQAIFYILSHIGSYLVGPLYTIDPNADVKDKQIQTKRYTYNCYHCIFYTIGVISTIFATIDGTFFDSYSHFREIRYQSILSGSLSMIMYATIIKHATEELDMATVTKTTDKDSQKHGNTRDKYNKYNYSSRLFIWNRVIKLDAWNNSKYNLLYKRAMYAMVLGTLLGDVCCIIFLIYYIVEIRLISGIIWIIWVIFFLFPLHIHVTCMIFSFWYQKLVCTELNVKLQKFLILATKPQNASETAENNINMYLWYENVYYTRWKVCETRILKKFNFSLLITLCLALTTIWFCLTHVLDFIVVDNISNVYTFSSWICAMVLAFVFIIVNVMFLCQSTKDYNNMIKMIDKIAMTQLRNLYKQPELIDNNFKDKSLVAFSDKNKAIAITMQNVRNNSWLQCMQCKTGMQMHTLNGTIYKYEVSWLKIFRATIVFTTSKLIVYFVTLNFEN